MEMGRKKLPKIIIFAMFALIALLIIPLAGGGCTGGGISLPTASPASSLIQATTCKSVDAQTGEPVEPTNTFSTGTSEIFCSVKLSNLPSNSEIESEWIYVKGETGETVNYLVETYSSIAGDASYLSFSITRPETGWPKGDYKIIFRLDGEEELTTSFKIQ